MSDLKFTIKDCDDVIKQCLKLNNIRTADFEVIPRHKDNFILIITSEHECTTETSYLYAKPKSRLPLIDKIIYEDFKNALPGFNPKITPKFYCGKSELLFFEDLTCQKFQTNLNLFDLKHVQQVLDVLAEFHAAGFAFEETKKKKLNEEYELEDSNFDLKEAEDLLWSAMDNNDNVDDIKRKLTERQHTSLAKVLCHSNLSSGNMLFHYENGIPDECKLINFKAKLYASPLYDVLQLIFLNTSEEFRQQNFYSLLIYYYSHLMEELRKYQIELNEILPVKDFRLSSHYLIPLVKVEAALRNRNTPQRNKTFKELKEVLSFTRLSREDCYVIIKKKICSSDYELLSFKETPLDIEGNFKLTLRIRRFLDEKTVNCFVKSLPKVTACSKEIFMYDTFLPRLQELGVDAVDDCLPPCYFQRPEDLMVFEDMSTQNFRSLSALNSSDFNLLSIIVKKLAKLHAGSLIFEEKMTEKLKTTYLMIGDYGPQLKTSFLEDDCSFEKLMNFLKDVVNLFPEFRTETHEETLKKCFPKFFESFFTEGFRSVVCHGEVKLKNILVQFDDDLPIDCRLIDYHCVKYCPPAYDFLSAVYLSTNQDTRIKNEETLMKIYYDELAKTLSSYNYKADKLFPYEEFVDSVEFLKPRMMIETAMYNFFVLCCREEGSSGDEICDWVLSEERKKILPTLCENSRIFEKRLRENIVGLYEMCNCMLPSL